VAECQGRQVSCHLRSWIACGVERHPSGLQDRQAQLVLDAARRRPLSNPRIPSPGGGGEGVRVALSARGAPRGLGNILHVNTLPALAGGPRRHAGGRGLWVGLRDSPKMLASRNGCNARFTLHGVEPPVRRS
jgi:hypothetical protein